MSIPGYKNVILAESSLSSYYRLNDAAAPIVDSSGLGLSGSLAGTPTLQQAALINDGTAASINFTHTTDLVNVNDSSVLQFGTASFSLEYWIKTSTTGVLRFPVYKGAASTGEAGFQCRITNTNVTEIVIADGVNGRPSVNGATNICDGLAHHVVHVCDRSLNQLLAYTDGALDATTSISPTFGSQTNTGKVLAMGSALSTNTAGFLAEAAFYKGVALAAAQVRNHYNAGKIAMLAGVPLIAQTRDGLITLRAR